MPMPLTLYLPQLGDRGYRMFVRYFENARTLLVITWNTNLVFIVFENVPDFRNDLFEQVAVIIYERKREEDLNKFII